MKVKPRYRGRAKASAPGSSSDVSSFIPPEVETIHCEEFIEFYHTHDIDQIGVKTSLIGWVPVLDRIDDFLSDRNLPSPYLIKILSILRSLLGNTNDTRIFNSVEHLVDLLWHPSVELVLQNVQCITTLLRSSAARVSSRYLSPLRLRLQFLATGLILSDSSSLKTIYTGESVPPTRPFTISGPSLDSPIVIDINTIGADPMDVASKIIAKLPCSDVSAFQINHRVALNLGSEETRRIYVHLILRSIQAGILLPSSNPSNYVQLSGIVNVAQQIVSLIEDVDRLPSVSFDDDIAVIALQTLQLLSSFDCYRRKLIEANIFEENGAVLNGFLLSAESARAAVGLVPESHLVFKRFSSYASLLSELVPYRGSASVSESGSRSDRLAVVGVAIDDDVVVRSLVSILSSPNVCPFHTINDVCSLLTTLLLNNSAARAAFLEQNAFSSVFSQMRLILDCAQNIDSQQKGFHGAIQMLLRVISILLQRSRATISQQILHDVDFVRLMTHLWETCLIGPSPAQTPLDASRNPSSVDMRMLLMNTSEPTSVASSPSHTPANLSNSSDSPDFKIPFNPTESGLLVFTTACNIVSRFIQNRPRSLQTLHREGITSAYLHWFPLVLDCVGLCKPEYRESMIKILLDLIRSLSIHSAGLSAILAADPVRRVLQLFECPDLYDYFSSSQSTVQSIGRCIDEWIRHYPDFEESVIGAITNALTRFQDGPGALIFADCHARHSSPSAPSLEQVFDQAIVNICTFIKCVVQRHVAKFCALNGPSQLCAFATAPGACFRTLGISRGSDIMELPPAFILPTQHKSSAFGTPKTLIAGKLTTAGDALAECYAWLAVQQARLPIDVLLDRVQKSCESVIRSQGFQSCDFLWPFEELLSSRRLEQAQEHAVALSSLHLFISILLRIVHRTPSFHIRQAQLSSLFAMLSKIAAKIDWALSGLDADSSVVPSDLAQNSAVIDVLSPYKFTLEQFSITVHGLMVALSERGSSRASDHNVFISIIASHAAYMINSKPVPVSPNIADVFCRWSDCTRQDSPTSMDEHKSLSASWCSLFSYTAKVFENAREYLFSTRDSGSFSNQEVANARVILNELLNSGAISRMVDLWRWVLDVRPNDRPDSSNPWGGNQPGPKRSSSKKSRKTRNQSDAPTSMPSWQWPVELDDNLLHCIDMLLIALSRFIATLSLLPLAAFSSLHDKFNALAATLFEDVWRDPGAFPLPVVISMLQSSQAFAALHSVGTDSIQANSSRAPVPASDTDDDQDDDNDDRSQHDMQEDDGHQSGPDRDVDDDGRRSLMFAQLSEMGFSDEHITWALENSNVRNFNALVDLMFDHPYTGDPGAGAASVSESVAVASSEAASNNVAAAQAVSAEVSAFAAVEQKFNSIAIPNVDCLAVERAIVAVPLLIAISKSFCSVDGVPKGESDLEEYSTEISNFVQRVIDASKSDRARIESFLNHFARELVTMFNLGDVADPEHNSIIQTALSVCLQVVSSSKLFAVHFSSHAGFCIAVLRSASQLLALSESSACAKRISLSISGLFTWLSSVWCSGLEGCLPLVSVPSEIRLQMASNLVQLLSSPIANDIEVTQSILACLITLWSQCGISSFSIKSLLLVKRPLSLDSAKTISTLVDTVLHLLIEDSSLVKSSIQKSLNALLESASNAEISLTQFFDRNRSVLLRSVQDFASAAVCSCQLVKKVSFSGPALNAINLRQRSTGFSTDTSSPQWSQNLGEVMDQIIYLVSCGNGAVLSSSFIFSLCDPLRLLHAIRTIAHLHSPHLHKFIIDYPGPAQASRHRFIDIVVLKLLTIRGSNLKSENCSAELATTLAKDLRRAAQMTLIELCIAGDEIAAPVFECLRDAIRRDVGDDRCVARYATAVLSLLRNSPNERERACTMIKIGMIPTLVDALQSLNVKGQQFSECCDGILRTLEAFGSLDLTTPLVRAGPENANAEEQAEEVDQMDIVGGIVDHFPNQSSRNSSIENAGAEATGSCHDMEEENVNEDEGGNIIDQEALALIDQEDDDDDAQQEADEDVEDDVVANDFINDLLNFGPSVSDEYEESEYDEEDIDYANRHDNDNDYENDDDDEEELAVADLSSPAINIRTANGNGLHAFSQRIFPQQLQEIVHLRGPVIDIGIDFGNVAALNQTDERLRRVLEDFQSSVDTSDIDVLMSNGAVHANRADENARRRLSTASHRNIVVRASRHGDDDLPWLSENSSVNRHSNSRTQILRRSTIPGDGHRFNEIIVDANRMRGHLQNRQFATRSLSGTSWAARMMELSGSLIKESIGNYFMAEYHKQQVEEQQNQSSLAQQSEPTLSSEPIADEIESVASTNVAVSVASISGAGVPDVQINPVGELALASADEMDENMEQVARVPADVAAEQADDPQELVQSASVSAQNGESSTGLSEEERLAFLAALPPELQAEILLQDSRQQAAHANPEAIHPSMVADIDSASFIATLPQDVREEFLMGQDDNFLSSLPPELMAEAVLLRQRNIYSERDELPPSIRRRGQVPRPPAISNTEQESQAPASAGIPLLPARLVTPLISLFKVRNFDCLATVQRVIRVMSQFPQTRDSLLRVLYSICIAFTPSRTSQSPKRLPSYLLCRSLNALRFLSKSTCRDDILLWFLLPEDSSPIRDILPLIYVARLDMSEPSLLSLFGFLEDVLSVFKDSSDASSQIRKSTVSVPDISASAVANMVAIANAKVCTTRISDMIMHCISVFAKSPNNRVTIISELTESLKAVRTSLEPLKLDQRRPGEIALFQSMILRNLNLLKSVVEDFSQLNQQCSDAVLSCVADLMPLWSELHRVLCSLQMNAANIVSSVTNENTTSLEKSLQYKSLIEAMFVQRKIASTPDMNKAFKAFCQTHRRVLNFLCSRYPKLLSGSLSELITMRSGNILDFENKRRYFRSQLESQFSSFRSRYRSMKLQVRRDRLFEDSYHQIRNQTLNELRSHMTVHFMGEEGMDAGGLTREWFLVMSREIFNPNYALFRNAADSQVVFQPNKFSYWNPEHIDFFRFVGRFVGKAIYQGCLLDAYFTRSFYKHMLGIKPSFSDMESIDPDFYKSLKWMLANPIKGVLDLTFSAETHEFGESRVFALKPDGQNVPVTDENKQEYVSLITELRTTTEIKAQIDAFVAGFHELIPKELINVFNDHDLELLICGLPEIDISDLRANTEYHGLSETSDVIQWFWAALHSFTSEEKALFIQFVTGTSKVPIGGFRALQGMSGVQKFQIHRGTGIDRLPTTHTCFNQLDLPDYSSPDSLADKLRIAISEGATGFGFA